MAPKPILRRVIDCFRILYSCLVNMVHTFHFLATSKCYDPSCIILLRQPEIKPLDNSLDALFLDPA